MYRTAGFVADRTETTFRKGLDEVLRIYNHCGYKIETIHCDNEFRPMMDPIKDDMGIHMDYCPATAHQPDAERNNRTIKDRVRSTFHRMPYDNIPMVLWKYLVMGCAFGLNLFAPTGSSSKFYSPFQLMHDKVLDFKRYCAIPFGSYVLAPSGHLKTNTQQARMLDCIYLRPTAHDRSGVELFDLYSKKVITRPYCKQSPIPESVIARVNLLAKNDNQKGLIIQSKRGKVLWDSTWFAGVEELPEDDDDVSVQSEDDDDSASDSDDDEQGLDGPDDPDSDDDDGRGEVDEDLLSQDGDDEGGTTQAESNNQPRQARRSKRISNLPRTSYTYAQVVKDPILEPKKAREEIYTDEMAAVWAHIMVHLHQACMVDPKTYEVKKHRRYIYKKRKGKKVLNLVQTYTLNKAMKKWGERATAAALKEMKQLHDRVCFAPIDPSTLDPVEIERALESFMFLVEKKTGEVKARTVGDGSTQRSWMGREETSSPTVNTSSIFVTATTDARERRSVATVDVPNAFIQTDMKKKDKDGYRYILKIRGTLVDMLVKLAPETYAPHVIVERGNKVLYLQTLKALYGMLQSSLLYYEKFRKAIEEQGFEVNKYDPCVANKMVNGQQLTVCWHVDDLKISHVSQEVVDSFIEWIKKEFGKVGTVKVCKGDIHPYVGFTLDYSEPGAVLIDMRDYVAQVIQDFPETVVGAAPTPAAKGLFDVNLDSKPLNAKRAEAFHSTVAQLLFLAKRGRPDILTAVSFLCTRVTKSTEEDWRKLKRVILWLQKTKDEVLRLKSDGTAVVHWYVDASFAVHPDLRSHNGAAMTLGWGCLIAFSCKQKMNTRSSTEAELIAVDDMISDIIWTKNFIEAQGYKVEENYIYQDNQSTIKLIQNGMASAGKRSRHLNIRHFFVKDKNDSKEVTTVYRPTLDMLGDYFSKPTQGSLNKHQRGKVMGRIHHAEPYNEAQMAILTEPICFMTLWDPGFVETEAGRYIDDDDYRQGLVNSKWDMCG